MQFEIMEYFIIYLQVSIDFDSFEFYSALYASSSIKADIKVSRMNAYTS